MKEWSRDNCFNLKERGKRMMIDPTRDLRVIPGREGKEIKI
jgi:hypothetical protein